MKVGAEARAMARIAGEVQRYQFGPDGDEWVKAQDYADLNEYSALVEMNLQAQIDLNEAYEARLLAEVERLRQLYDNEHTIACRLRTALKTVGDDYPGSSCQQWCYEQAGLTPPDAKLGQEEG